MKNQTIDFTLKKKSEQEDERLSRLSRISRLRQILNEILNELLSQSILRRRYREEISLEYTTATLVLTNGENKPVVILCLPRTPLSVQMH